MKSVPFNFDSLDINELLSNDELTSISAGSSIAGDLPSAIFDPGTTATPSYTEATIIWSQIP